MKKIFPALLLTSLLGISAQARIVTYPAGEGVKTTDAYTVRVRQAGTEWNNVAVYPVKVDEVRGTKHHVEISSMAYFDFDGTPVEIEVTSHTAAIDTARIRPLSYDITPSYVRGDSVLRFTLDSPRNLSVEINGDIFHNLQLFANPLDSRRPSAKALRNLKKQKNLIYFAPGYHKLPGDTLRIPSGTTVYVDGGARVAGQLIADRARDIRIYGRGEIHPEGRGEGIYIKRSRNIDIEGVIVTQVPVGESDSVTITNVKSISSYGWGDGMNVFASSNVTYDSVFCRNSDDCSTVYATRKGFNGGCHNILMKNSTLWADVAHPIMIGLHGNAEGCDTISNIVYRNIDILDQQEKQIDYQGCFGISCGDNNVVENVTFDNIRVEDFRQGQLVNIRIFFNKKYCLAPGRAIRNILFKDITYNGHRAELSIIAGYDSEHTVEGITFENLVINGERISDNMPGKPAWYKTGDMCRFFIGEHVHNVVFK